MIEFITEEFFEDDHSWLALFVKTDDRDWHMAHPNYGTEDKKEIIQQLKNDG
jgi:hypothetical protein